MSSHAMALSEIPVASPIGRRNWLGPFHRLEDMAISSALALMMLLPLAEAALGRTIHAGIPASTSLVQQMVLIVDMLGGAIGAREGRLLLLSTVGEGFLKGKWKGVSRVATGGFAAAVTAFLSMAAFQFVLAEREGGKLLAVGVPIWMIEVFLPAGFAIIALRVLWQVCERWELRGLASGVAAIFAGGAAVWPATSHDFVAISLAALFVASLLGVPALVTLGGAALILFRGMDQPIAAIPIGHYSLGTNPSLPTMPLFTLAGYFLAEGGAAKRLVRVFQALLGSFRGGPAIVTALVCAFFTSFTGASGVTILALGGLLMPMLLAARYKPKDALGLVTGAGSLGLLFPPCLPLILYAIVATLPIESIFLGRIVPGIL